MFEVWYPVVAIILGFIIWGIAAGSFKNILPEAARIVYGCGWFFTLWLLMRRVLRLG